VANTKLSLTMPSRFSIKDLRRIIRKKKRPKKLFIKKTLPLFRLIRLQIFFIMRYLVYFCFRLWLNKIKHYERLPKDGPAIIVSNHLSYYDWAVLSAIYWDKHLVFIGNKALLDRPFVGWLMKLNILIFIDPQNPGLKYFKESIRRLRDGHILVIYPEGMRSRSGKMLEPKTGFVKIAAKTGVPLIPIAMRGTYQILPPHKRIPAFRRCDIIVGEAMKINRRNKLIRDIYLKKGVEENLNEEDEKEIALRIMEQIRISANQDWDNKVNL
jgi:1-acyl-sn-glycerol-3-phosphate acyltransferase